MPCRVAPSLTSGSLSSGTSLKMVMDESAGGPRAADLAGRLSGGAAMTAAANAHTIIHIAIRLTIIVPDTAASLFSPEFLGLRADHGLIFSIAATASTSQRSFCGWLL